MTLDRVDALDTLSRWIKTILVIFQNVIEVALQSVELSHYNFQVTFELLLASVEQSEGSLDWSKGLLETTGPHLELACQEGVWNYFSVVFSVELDQNIGLGDDVLKSLFKILNLLGGQVLLEQKLAFFLFFLLYLLRSLLGLRLIRSEFDQKLLSFAEVILTHSGLADADSQSSQLLVRCDHLLTIIAQ